MVLLRKIGIVETLVDFIRPQVFLNPHLLDFELVLRTCNVTQ